MRQFKCVPTTYVTEIKETYFEIYIYQEPCPFKHLNPQISIKIPVTIWQIVFILHDSYITKFDFMNYAFAKLVIAW